MTATTEAPERNPIRWAIVGLAVVATALLVALVGREGSTVGNGERLSTYVTGTGPAVATTSDYPAAR